MSSVVVAISPTFAYVSAGVLDGGVAVDVGQQTQAEAVLVVRRVCETVHQDAARGRVERLTDPVVELVVRDGTPVLWLFVAHGP